MTRRILSMSLEAHFQEEPVLPNYFIQSFELPILVAVNVKVPVVGDNPVIILILVETICAQMESFAFPQSHLPFRAVQNNAAWGFTIRGTQKFRIPDRGNLLVLFEFLGEKFFPPDKLSAVHVIAYHSPVIQQHHNGVVTTHANIINISVFRS